MTLNLIKASFEVLGFILHVKAGSGKTTFSSILALTCLCMHADISIHQNVCHFQPRELSEIKKSTTLFNMFNSDYYELGINGNKQSHLHILT